MMALPRSATKALKLWPWKDVEGAPGTREPKDRNGSIASFESPAEVAEEFKFGESEVVEDEANVPFLRSPSKLVKKRDGSRKELATPTPAAPIAEPIAEAPDVPSRPDTPLSTHASASVDSHTAEHVIVPPHPPATPTPKHNVLVKKNSVKRAAAKPVLPEEPVPMSEGGAEPEDFVAPKPTAEVPDLATDEPDIPNEDGATGDEGSEDGTLIHATAPPALDVEPEPEVPTQIHPFPMRGGTPPSGTRFIEGADGSLEPTESCTTGTTGPPARPGRPTRRISLRSFGFFYGKDSRPTSASFFPTYVPPTDRIVYEVGDESEPEVEVERIQRPILTHKRNSSRLSIGLLGSRKVSAPKVTKGDKRAVESALSLRTLIIGPAALDVNDRNKDKGKKSNDPKASAAAALRKVNQQLLVPHEANRVIAALRELPPPDLPPATAETVETVRRKKGWVFGRGGVKGDKGKEREKVKVEVGTVAMPIHGCCLDLTDEEAEEKHFSKLTGSAFGVQRAGEAQANANIGSADLSSLIPVLKNMRLVNLQASPDVSSMNAASLGAQLSAPDLGFGQPADKDGPLAGSVPSAGSLVDGMEKVGQTLMSLGFATTAAVLPSHVGVHPPRDRMSVLTYWWGYEVVFPPPTMRYLGHVKSISGALLNFLTAFALFSNGVREMLPFVRYIAQFIDFEWGAIKAQDKGRGVVCAATWVMPAALVPRPWDFVDPPIAVKPGRSVTPGPATREFSSQAVAPAGAPEPAASGTGGTEAIAEMDGDEGAGAFNTEVRDGKALARGDENDELEDQREDDRGSRAEVATTPIVETPATVPRHEADPNTKDS